MKKVINRHFNFQLIRLFLVTGAILCNKSSMSQTMTDAVDLGTPATDVGDVVRAVFKK